MMKHGPGFRSAMEGLFYSRNVAYQDALRYAQERRQGRGSSAAPRGLRPSPIVEQP